MSSKHYVITIERQYGSGGRITGMRLAEELGIHYYDEEILKMTSETSAIGEQYPSLGFSTITFGSNKIPLLL